MALIVKYGGVQSGQAIKLFQEPRKISFTLHSWHQSFILDDAKLADCYPTAVLNERIMRYLYGVKTYSDRSYLFSVGHDPLTPRIYANAGSELLISLLEAGQVLIDFRCHWWSAEQHVSTCK